MVGKSNPVHDAMKTEPIFEKKRRWPGAPLICIAANLPSFRNQAELDKFHKSNGNDSQIERQWVCKVCKRLHYWINSLRKGYESKSLTRIVRATT